MNASSHTDKSKFRKNDIKLIHIALSYTYTPTHINTVIKNT